MATRPKPDDVLPAILAELQTLNQAAAQIVALLSAQNAASFAPGRTRDPGDSVPPGVAVQEPGPVTPDDAKVRRALERLPRRRKPA